MPQAEEIVLHDAQATPEPHTFVPIGRDAKDPQTFWYEDQSRANALGFWRISIKTVRPPMSNNPGTRADRTFRVVVGLHTPVLENVSNSTVSGIVPAPTLSYVPRSFTEYVMQERSTTLDRKNLRKMTSELQDNEQVVNVVENLLTYN